MSHRFTRYMFNRVAPFRHDGVAQNYLLAHFGKSLIWHATDGLTVYILVECWRIDLITAGTIAFIAMMWSAFCDFAWGAWLDRRRERGKTVNRQLRYAGWAMVLFFLISSLIWAFIPLSAPTVVLPVLMLARFAYSAYDVPHNMLLVHLPRNPIEQALYIRNRSVISVSASLLLGLVWFGSVKYSWDVPTLSGGLPTALLFLGGVAIWCVNRNLLPLSSSVKGGFRQMDLYEDSEILISQDLESDSRFGPNENHFGVQTRKVGAFWPDSAMPLLIALIASATLGALAIGTTTRTFLLNPDVTAGGERDAAQIFLWLALGRITAILTLINPLWHLRTTMAATYISAALLIFLATIAQFPGWGLGIMIASLGFVGTGSNMLNWVGVSHWLCSTSWRKHHSSLVYAGLSSSGKVSGAVSTWVSVYWIAEDWNNLPIVLCLTCLLISVFSLFPTRNRYYRHYGQSLT